MKSSRNRLGKMFSMVKKSERIIYYSRTPTFKAQVFRATLRDHKTLAELTK